MIPPLLDNLNEQLFFISAIWAPSPEQLSLSENHLHYDKGSRVLGPLADMPCNHLISGFDDSVICFRFKNLFQFFVGMSSLDKLVNPTRFGEVR